MEEEIIDSSFKLEISFSPPYQGFDLLLYKDGKEIQDTAITGDDLVMVKTLLNTCPYLFEHERDYDPLKIIERYQEIREYYKNKIK